MRRLILLLSFVSAWTLTASAQAPAAPPPPLGPGPLLNRAPAMSQWLISIKSNPGGDAVTPDAHTTYDTRTLVIKTGSTRYELTEKADGTKTQKWCIGGVQALVFPNSKEPQLVLGGGGATNSYDPNYTDYSKSDFAGFEWISRSNYVGVQTVEGVPCIVFQATPVASTDSGPATAPQMAPVTSGTSAAGTAPMGGNAAYIASDSRLPVLLQVDGVTSFYQFRPPPAGMLTPPPAVQDVVQQWQQRVQSAQTAPAAP